MLSRPPRALIVGAVASALAAGVAATGALDRVENLAVDARYDVRGARATPPGVAVVGIDEATYAVHGFPFERALHARAIRRLLAAGARGIAYDVQFSEPGDRADDAALVAAARDPRVTLGTAELTRAGEPVALPALRRRAAGRIGFALVPRDPDGTVRTLQARFHRLPHLAVLAAGGDPAAPRRPIDFAGPGGTVRQLSFDDVVTGRFDTSAVRGRIVVVGATAPILQDVHPTATDPAMSGAEVNANAIQTVLDGYPLRDAPGAVAALLLIAAGLLAPLATIPGPPARAVAQALAAGLLGAAALLGGAQLAFGAGTIVPTAAPLLALLVGTAGAVGLTYAVEVRARRRLRVEFERFVAPAVARELLARHDERPAAGRRTSPAVGRRLLSPAGRRLLSPAGRRRTSAATDDAPPAAGPAGLPSRRVEATVLFCDLRGFTALAERLGAERVIAVLNRYLSLVSGTLLDHGGTIVSYQGDGVMAVFGAPLPQPDHAARALTAARALIDDALPAFNGWLLERRLADAPLDAGIGVNSGAVMAGVVGSERRVEYAAVGDATNVAARLQGLGRELPGRLFVAEATVAAAGGAERAPGLRPHGPVTLKGRREPVTVYVEA